MVIWKRNSGLTLVGVLVATLILTGGILAVVRLMAQTEKNSGFSQEKFVAANLAREGLELVQAHRDNNWFTPRTAWAKGMCPESSRSEHRFIIEPDVRRPFIKITSDVLPREETTALYLTPDDQWTHQASGATRTAFKRWLTVNCVNQDKQPIDDEAAYITVTAEVYWESRGGSRSVTVQERLYNWLPVTSCTRADPIFVLVDTNADGTLIRAEGEAVYNALQTILANCPAGVCNAGGNEHFDVDSDGQLTGLDTRRIVNVINACAPL